MSQRVEEDLLELQARLRGDASGEALAALISRFEHLGLDAKRRLDAGVPPAEFAPLSNVMQAAAAAQAVVSRVWQGFHPAGGAR